MSLQIQLKKSAVSQKQPFASDLAVGEIALNYNADGPFLTCKDSAGNVRKLNNVWVNNSAPTNPGTGDLWLDTSGSTAVLKVYKDSNTAWSNATAVPIATTSVYGTVQLASTADIANATAGKVVDAAQLQSKITEGLAGDTLTFKGVNVLENVTIGGDLTVNGTTTTVSSETLLVEDKNIEMGVVATPTDTTADGGGITLKGTTDKTLNWSNASDSWTSSENVDLASGKSYRINGTEVLSATALGSAVQITSANIPTGTIVDSDINASAEIAVSKLADGAARQLLQTDAAGTGVEWTDNVDIPGTLDVTGAATFDSSVAVIGTLTKSGNDVVTVGDTGTVTSTMIADGTIVDGDINASAAIADTKLATIATAGKVSNSATTATDANTASAIVARDASGNFSAGAITASLTGNASSATALATARTIGGVSFDGTANIDLPGVNTAGNQDTSGNAATATKLSTARTFEITGDITGTVSSDLTSGASIAAAIASGVIVDADINATAAIADTKLATISTAGKVSNSATTATDANTASAIVARDASGNFAAGTITADLAGNAATVTTNANLTGDVTSVGNATSIAAGVIVDADVNASAAIAGTKISPDFGAQNVTTTGTSTAASFIPTSSTVPTNGVYLPAANSVALSTNGVQRINIEADGDINIDSGGVFYDATNNRLAIGTTSPTSLLDVRATSGNVDTYIGVGDVSLARIRVGYQGTGFAGTADGGAVTTDSLGSVNLATRSGVTNNIAFATSTGTGAATERLRITSAGLVGIGTSSPTNYGAGVTSLSVNGPAGGVADFYYNGARQGWIGALGSNQMVIDTAGAAIPLTLKTNNITALTIDTSQRVGIGTTSPGVALHVDGDIRADGIYGETDTNTSIQFPGSDVITFNEGGSEAARIDSSGRLLVGTSSDSGGALLQVNGNRIRVATAKTPSSASDTGTAGEICWDASYIYVCTATNTWKRAALSTW